MALAKRIIPCLDVDNGRVVKGVQFVDIRDAGDPVEIARRYDEQGADEITFLDITASSDDRETIVHVVEDVASQVFIPLTVGGGIRTIDDVRRHPEAIMAYSKEMKQHNLILKRFLRENLYRHYRVLRMSAKSKRIIIALFNAFMEDSQLLPTEHRKKALQLESELGESGKALIIADYIAGMTDRYAIAEHERIFNAKII